MGGLSLKLEEAMRHRDFLHAGNLISRWEVLKMWRRLDCRRRLMLECSISRPEMAWDFIQGQDQRSMSYATFFAQARRRRDSAPATFSRWGQGWVGLGLGWLAVGA